MTEAVIIMLLVLEWYNLDHVQLKWAILAFWNVRHSPIIKEKQNKAIKFIGSIYFQILHQASIIFCKKSGINTNVRSFKMTQ